MNINKCADALFVRPKQCAMCNVVMVAAVVARLALDMCSVCVCVCAPSIAAVADAALLLSPLPFKCDTLMHTNKMHLRRMLAAE